MTVSPDNPFSKAQRLFYDGEALLPETPDGRDPVVGDWDALNSWPDFPLLFDGTDTKDKYALDFGCGPGRCLVLYKNDFFRIDGADVGRQNLVNAGRYCRENGISPTLYPTNGVDLRTVPTDYYDVVFSVITLQHIPVHSIRKQLFGEFFRVLSVGGYFTAQTGFGETNDPRGVPYYENRWDADKFNGGCDVVVSSTDQLKHDLEGVGFESFTSVIRPAGPGDWHPNWVFFRARKGS